MGLDAIEQRMGRLRRSILTYIDEVSGYALARAPTRNSRATRDCFETCFRLTSLHIQHAITEGGSEFKGAFDQRLNDSQTAHLGLAGAFEQKLTVSPPRTHLKP